MNKRQNDSPDFVGLDALKDKHSLRLLGFDEEFNSIREFALPLIRSGLNFRYRSRDCAAIFLE